MGVLARYLSDNNKLPAISQSAKDNILKLENKILQANGSTSSKNFDSCLEKSAPNIADLIRRASSSMDADGLTGWFKAFSRLKMVYNIAFEAKQIVENIYNCCKTDGMTPQEAHDVKVGIGKQLVFFVWEAVDPLKKIVFPFRKLIEQRLVLWLSGLALNSVVDLFEAHGNTISAFGVSTAKKNSKRLTIIKAI